MPTEQARVALSEVVELLEAAEAKAYYGIAINWAPLQALTEALLDRGVLQGREVEQVLEAAGVVHFPDPYTRGFGWDDAGTLDYPLKPSREAGGEDGEGAAEKESDGEERELVGAAAKTRFAGTDLDAPRDADGKFKYGWHWNSPWSVRRDVPGWLQKEVERYGV